MDWNSIEHLLKDTIGGIIFLSAIGGALLLAMLNLYGRANKGIKKLRILYREGRKQILISLINDEQYFEYFKYKCVIHTIEACVLSLMSLAIYFTVIVFEIIIPLVFLFVGLIVFWAIVLFRRSLLEKAFYAKMVTMNDPSLLDKKED
ncbi:MAG: hypothetical protein AAF090_11660 [Bacteroidota bacterium]